MQFKSQKRLATGFGSLCHK